MDSFVRTESAAIAFDKVRQVMHLSMLSPRGWESGYPQGFDCEVCPQGGEFDMATILDNEEGVEINLVPKAFPAPGSAGKALGTRLPKNKSAILENTRNAFK